MSDLTDTAKNEAPLMLTVRQLAEALCEHGCVAPVVDAEVPYGCRDCTQVAQRIAVTYVIPPAVTEGPSGNQSLT